MGAWMLPDLHHNVLAVATVDFGALPLGDARSAASLLKAANAASIGGRHGDAIDPAVVWRRAGAANGCDPLLVLKSLACWDDQSRECGPHPPAPRALVDRLRHAAIDRLPETERLDHAALPRCQRLPWGLLDDLPEPAPVG